MSSLVEFARGLLVLGYYFGLMPVGNVAILRAYRRGGEEAAREVLTNRAARALRLGGIEVEVEGELDVPEGGIVIVCNETSLIDVIVFHLVIWRVANRGVGAAEFGLIPLLRPVAKRLGVHLLRRGDRAAADRFLDEMSQAVARGERVAMSGQGHLSPDGEVGHFKRGSVLIALRGGVDLVPLAIQGGREILRPNAIRLRPGKIRLRYGAPISCEGFDEDRAPELAERVRKAVSLLKDAAASEGDSAPPELQMAGILQTDS